MVKVTTYYNDRYIIIFVPCTLTAIGIEHCLRSLLEKDTTFEVIHSINEAFTAVFNHPDATIVMDVNDKPILRSEEVAFIHWCLAIQPEIAIVAFTLNHKPGVLNYLSALGLRAIISQYESTSVFNACFIKSNARIGFLASPMIASILQGSMVVELTPREIQVLDKLFLGKNVHQAAEELGRDIRTISTHKRHAMKKLGLHCERDLHLLGCELSGK